MTFDQYWYGDVWLSKVYLEADRVRKEQINQKLWLQGMYFYDAISCSLQNAFRKKTDKPAVYPEKPYRIFPMTEAEKKAAAAAEAEEQRKRAIAYFNSFAKHKKKLD